jgi:hypothetical protein
MMRPTPFIVSAMHDKGYAPEKIERVRHILERVDRTLGIEPPWPFNAPPLESADDY